MSAIRAADDSTTSPTAPTASPTEDLLTPQIDQTLSDLSQLDADAQTILVHLAELKRARLSGKSWRDSICDDPHVTMKEVAGLLGRYAQTSGDIRGALVHQLRNEGLSIPAIARVLNVTHQRISALLSSKHNRR